MDERVKETERERQKLSSRKALADEQLEALRQEVASARYMQTLYSAGGGIGGGGLPAADAGPKTAGAGASSGGGVDDVDSESTPVGRGTLTPPPASSPRRRTASSSSRREPARTDSRNSLAAAAAAESNGKDKGGRDAAEEMRALLGLPGAS